MKRFLLAATAALVLAACADTRSSPVEPASPAAKPRFALGDVWTIFTNQTPASTLDASPGWEVATRFYTTKQVCLLYFRFWRGSGETGTNRIRLWTNSGTEIVSRVADSTPSSGWAYAYVSSIVVLQPYTNYRVSVNTNTKQVKSFGVFQNGPIINGPMVATDGYYGQPTGVMPTTHSYSNFFVDVVVSEC